MTKEEREREIFTVTKMLPRCPEDRDKVIELLTERKLIGEHRMVFKVDSYYDPLEDRRKQAILCRCSACGGSFYCQKIMAAAGCWHGQSKIGYYNGTIEVYNGDITLCPMCGTGLTAMHVGSFGSGDWKYLDGTHFCTVYNIAGHLAVLDWFTERRVNKSAEICTDIYGYEGCVVIDGTYYRVSGHKTNIGGGDIWFPWEQRKGRVFDLTRVSSKNELIPFDEALISETDADKSGFEEFCREIRQDEATFVPCSYLQLWCRFPAVENLVRTGYARYVGDMIVASQVVHFAGYKAAYYFQPNYTKRFADWKKVKPNEILHMTKDEYRRMAGLKFSTINYFHDIMDNYGVKLSMELLQKADAVNTMRLREITKDHLHYGVRVSPVRIINYCYRQTQACRGTQRTFYPRDLLDHWRMLHDYYKELPISMMFPADFAAHHERISRLLTERRDKEMAAKIAKVMEQARRYAWQDEETGLLITPAKTDEDLIKEGKELCHCVGTYARAVAEGRTTIFFIRRIEEPDKPFFTLEYRNDRVIQNRGYKNCERTEQVKKFEERWLAHIEDLKKADAKAAKKAKKKEEKQHGQSDADGKRGSAAA